MQSILTVLLIEDDIHACNEIQHCIAQHDNLKLVGITNNSTEALELARAHLPNLIILDLELHYGGGNGLLFLNELNKNPISHPPYILITTNNMSESTLRQARQLGADFILAKYETGYCGQYVVDYIQIMRSAIFQKNSTIAPLPNITPAQKEQLIMKRIQREMELIGINPRAVGYKYLMDSIRLIMDGADSNIARILAPKYEKSVTSIERAMQNAIKQAWATSSMDDLLEHYTAKIRIDRGSPTLMEFVYYYANKIKNDME